MSASHTPTPWEVEVNPCSLPTVWAGNMVVANCGARVSDDITTEEADANAAFIVRACNAHDDLVSALRWFIDDIDGTHTVMVDFDRNVELARASLAKAEAQS